MGYNSFYINILLRILFMSFTNLGFFYLLAHRQRFFTLLFLGVLFILQVIWLFYYINSINRSLAIFLLTLGEEEIMPVSVRNKIEKTFRGLKHSFDRMNQEIGNLRLEKQYSLVLAQTIVDHMGSGIIAWDQTGHVEMVNGAGLKFLDVSRLSDIRQLEAKYPGFLATLEGIKKGKNMLITLPVAGESTPFLFRAIEFSLGEQKVTLVSFQSLRLEMEENEMVSWEKLMKVFTHEISNSVTPITTLGSNIKKRMSALMACRQERYAVDYEQAKDIHRSAELIEQRGNRLIDFIHQYKSMLRLPEPERRTTRLFDMIRDVCSLCGNLDSPMRYNIRYNVSPPDLHCTLDRKMMEQVLINLVRNAVDALGPGHEGQIEITAALQNENTCVIRVKDNGAGIHPDHIDQVFIPFFTTREKGSGIGLSLSRRIVQLHGGTLSLQSEFQKGTIVSIILPCQE